jgi:hypothetical protein
MHEEMYLVPRELMMCFNGIRRLRKLQADISEDLRFLEREAQRLILESPGDSQISCSENRVESIQ